MLGAIRSPPLAASGNRARAKRPWHRRWQIEVNASARNTAGPGAGRMQCSLSDLRTSEVAETGHVTARTGRFRTPSPGPGFT